MERFEAAITIDGQQVAGHLDDFEGTLEEMILEGWRYVSKVAIFAHSDELKQRAGLAGVMLVLLKQERHDEFKRIRQELDFWKALSAATSGVPVDFEAVFASVDPDDAVGLSKLWNQFQKEGE
jgi:DNA-binding sugar fermentation-stimulating protein